MRPAAASAAPGTGTVIPARAATSRACSIRSRSPKSSTRNGTGRRRYAPQPEILSYANHVADRFDLRRHILFDTRVTAAAFERLRNAGGSRPIAATGVGANSASWPSAACRRRTCPLQGREDFHGPIYHTGEWPHEGSISPGFASASSAPDRRRSSRSRSLRSKPRADRVPAYRDLHGAGAGTRS